MIRKLIFFLIFIKHSGKQKSNSPENPVFPVRYGTDTSLTKNDSSYEWNTSVSFDSQDQEILDILEELQPVEKVEIQIQQYSNSNVVSDLHFDGYFCSEFVLNLRWRVLTEVEISVFEKGLDFAPIQNKINQPELKTDFENFCQRVCTEWYFWNEPL